MNSKWIVATFFSLVTNIALRADEKSRIITKILSPRFDPTTGVTIHKRTKMFLDVEAPLERIWIDCSPTEKGAGLVGIYVADADTTYGFIYRRPFLKTKNCIEEVKLYRQMMKGSKTARVVGVDVDEDKNDLASYEDGKKYPVKFLKTQKSVSVFFTRFQVRDKCQPYFANSCDLPENYWAGMFPE